jgi:hypothetical protein
MRLERLASSKRISLLRTFVNYGRKKFYGIGLRVEQIVVSRFSITIGGCKSSNSSIMLKFRPKGNVFSATLGAGKVKRRPEPTLARNCVLCWMLWSLVWIKWIKIILVVFFHIKIRDTVSLAQWFRVCDFVLFFCFCLFRLRGNRTSNRQNRIKNKVAESEPLS